MDAHASFVGSRHGLWRTERHSVFCHTCRRTITVSHIMITCVRYRAVRARYYHVTSVKDLLDKVPTSAILSFLSDIGLMATIWVIFTSMRGVGAAMWSAMVPRGRKGSVSATPSLCVPLYILQSSLYVFTLVNINLLLSPSWRPMTD